MEAKTITFGLGMAGTGKSALACYQAATMLESKEISKIILTRPALEAGEKIGYLPGTEKEKVSVFYKPLYEYFVEYFGKGHCDYLFDHEIIEMSTLGFMRGSTFKDCVVIGDEMQNTTITQMKMFLTRIGENCKVFITGDPEQCDLPKISDSGLEDAAFRLGFDPEVGVVRFTEDDCVRSGLALRILKAYRNG